MEDNLKYKVQSVINDYNDIVDEYFNDFGNDEKYNIYIKKWLESLNDGEILDAGCGFARDSKYINTFKGFKSIGIDFADKMIEEAKARNPECIVSKMDMTNLLFEDNRFEGIISNCSMIHIPKELIETTLKGFKRVLKDNGGLLLVLLEGFGEEMVEEPYRLGKNVYVYTKYYEIEEIIDLLHNNGFSISDIDIRKTENNMELGGRELIVYGKNKTISKNEQLNEKQNLVDKLIK